MRSQSMHLLRRQALEVQGGYVYMPSALYLHIL